MAKTKFTNKPVQSEDVERAREEKREGKKKVEYSGKRKKGAVKESAPKWPETAGQEMDDSMIPRPYGVQERIRILRRMQFMSMRYPHPETIKELGIEEDVNDILYYTELGEFTKLALPAYREPAIEFLASLKLKKHPQEAAAELKRDGIGYITFTLLGQEYLFSMLELETIYKFEENRGLDTEMCVPATELHALWRMISSRSYQISKNKSGHIKNPAIRYAHKEIANTLFARHDCSNVTTQELELLDAGIIQKLETLDDGEEMKGDLRQTSKAVVMVRSFMHVMRNAELSYEQGKIKEAHLVIGSLITSILLATKVKLPAPSHPPTFMDLAYLNMTWFLRGMHDGKHVYRFEHPTFGISKVLLPNVELTNTNTREGILFLPTADQLFMDGGDATVEEEQGREEGETLERRSSKLGEFDLIPYNASGSAPAIIKAHEHIGMLQKWCKKQDEVIKKLTETVNVLKEKLSCKSPKATKAASPTKTVELALRRSKRKRKQAHRHLQRLPPIQLHFRIDSRCISFQLH
ncbi:unnamed protein product [Microthlaspi erraticum]|uniref:Arabidopsis retrotransposon Orf1 C-terminal domain-containing protein n=1 Tax=Microthlaspi erraticum TaxID=1685480 RepID=A0A6D2IC08_9BRAS|nr:unnamed protein product [Microthlaspi erraticum]